MKPSDPKSTEPVIAEMQISSGDAGAVSVNDCWNTIGVSGNSSCRELERFVHCRNCPVYSSAAVRLLDRPVTAEYRREWTEHFAGKKKVATPAKTSVVIFRVGPEWLALSTSAFQEIAERRTVHSLPHRRRGFVRGLVNVRGELLICISLSRVLALDQSETSFKSRTMFDRLLVANWDGSRFVFPVDEVHGIHRLQQSELRDPPATVVRSAATHTRKIFDWRERTVGVLDADLLFAALNRNLS